MLLTKIIHFTCLLGLVGSGQGFTSEITLLTHDSFTLDKALLQQFESQNQTHVNIIKGGDAGQMLNKLILSQGSLADLVFGIDNTLLKRAEKAKVIQPGTFQWIDTGYVTLNYDKANLKGKRLPKKLEDLLDPTFKNSLVTQNPATSSTGLAFLLATIHHFGPIKVWDFWADLRDNGLKVTRGWSDAYYTEFSKYGGRYPFVVSYASSPAAEVFYSDNKGLKESPTANLFLKGGVFQQFEGIALTSKAKNIPLAHKFIDFLRSRDVQKSIPTTLWMYPVISGINLHPTYAFAKRPTEFYSPKIDDPLLEKTDQWVEKWTDIVIKGEKP